MNMATKQLNGGGACVVAARGVARTLALLASVAVTAATPPPAAATPAPSPAAAAAASATSPDGRTEIRVAVGKDLAWQIVRDGRPLLDAASRLGLSFAGEQAEMTGFTLVSSRTVPVRDAFETRLYRRGRVDLAANETTLEVRASDGRRLGLVLRAYDDAVAFRYVIPGEGAFAIARERTSWVFPGDPEAWMAFYPADDQGRLFGTCGSEEGTFNKAKVNMIPKQGVIGVPAIVGCGETRLAICEADLTDWSALWFWTDNPWAHRRPTATLFARSPERPGEKGVIVRGQARRVSPWRVMILSETDAGLLERNDVVYALNPPPEGGEAAFDWVKPGATGWDWWADHAGVAVFPTTEQTLKQIDFAAEMGWPYHTVDAGWYGRPVKDDPKKPAPPVRLEPRDGFDLPKVLAHAQEKGVGIWLWFWWNVVDNEANGLEATFGKFARWGVKGVKIDFMDRGDQEMVNWYERVVRCAAKHRLMVNFHAAYHPTGMDRTWPNQVTREGICGNEMNKFYGWVTPTHMATLPYTRFLVGPGDYTPGSFGNVFSRDFVPQHEREQAAAKGARVFPQEVGTRGHALALCVAYDSPLTTLCDWPENYRGQPGLEVLRALPTTWKRTIPLRDGKIGESYSVLREAHDGTWHFAAFTVKARKARLPLFAMGEGDYEATVYADDPERTPKDATALKVFTTRLSHREALEIPLCDEGGCVVKIRRLSAPVAAEKPLKLLVLGNSITMHPKCGRFVGDCGMCASEPEKDFVHLVARGLERRLGRKVEFLARNIAGFESDFGLAEMGRRDPVLNAKAPRWKEDHAENLTQELAMKADVVIFAIGENVWRVKGEEDRALFMKEFAKLIGVVKANSNPLVLVRAPFWRAEWPRTWAMERVAKAEKCFYVDAGPLDDEGSTRALGFTGILGVDAHPGDKGMRLMAEQMLESLTGR